MTHLSRRTLIRSAASTGMLFALPRFAFAAGADARFVLVILRGALDGLAAVPAYGDSHYASQRGELAIATPDLKLDGLFALHPMLTRMHERYLAKELIVLHAAASPYRERSHFDGQDLLESGVGHGESAHDGWLNRALRTMPLAESRTSEQIAMALAQNIPLVLRGESRVSSWAPSRLPEADVDTLQRIADLYSADEYFAGRLRAALAADAVAEQGMDSQSTSERRDPLNAFGTIASAAGKFLAAPEGPRITVLEIGGWDTHANQGADRGQLAARLRGLDQGLDALRVALGSAWKNSAVLVVTEFGRTVAVNGTRGTDHGTATCAFLVGGAVSGGRVISDWPGLAPGALHESRDLRPTLDLRSVFKGVLAEHLKVAEHALEERVFPGSRTAKMIEGLIERA